MNAMTWKLWNCSFWAGVYLNVFIIYASHINDPKVDTYTVWNLEYSI